MRFINLGKINFNMSYALWEFPNLFDDIEPMVIIYRVDRVVLETVGTTKLSDHIYIDKIPNKIPIRRFRGSNDKYGVIIMSPHVICIILILPDLVDDYSIPILKYFRNKHISCYMKGNDLYFSKDSYDKKFGGTQIQTWDNGWTSYGIIISYDIDSNILNVIYKQNSPKFNKFSDVSSLNNHIGGLLEADSNLSIKEDMVNLLNEYQSHFSCSNNVDSFNDYEINVLLEKSMEISNGL
jgi:hypothetical protein